MALFKKKSPWGKEWNDLIKKENKFIEKRMSGPTCVIIGKLERFVPAKLRNTLNAAFFKGFQIIFEKGTGIIEKTYNKSRKENDFQINTFATELSADKRTVRKFTKQARSAKKINLLVSSVEGIGLGLVGAGVPDIPLFIAMVLKSVYEIALSYGYRYDTDEEKVFILKMIQIAMLDEEAFVEANREFNDCLLYTSHTSLYLRIPVMGLVRLLYSIFLNRFLEKRIAGQVKSKEPDWGWPLPIILFI